ncbi:ANR family transcriptional regulator [Haemophilus parainfluenzae]|uniref:ANR family transcriptional regulator n=1 Tax=Haemophilus parainfluenzae TaxID=729 RepID=UPI001E5AA09C|nr:ANR family transcriptional regulator [Haemophilus parainfluenzae]
MASQSTEKNSMRTKFIAFRTASETAAEAERAEQFLKAAQSWRKAYQLAPSTPDEDWCFARADRCFKAAIDTGAIKVRKSRQLDFKDFLL